MIVIGCIALVFAAELAVAGWSRSSFRRMVVDRDTSIYVDLLAGALNTLNLISPLILVYTLGGAFLVNHVAHADSMPLISGVSAAALYWLMVAFCDYWQHRLFHSSRMWPIHRFHHSATSMGPLTYYRVHPANLLVDPLYRTLPLAFLDVAPGALLFITAATTLHQVVLHVNQDWHWGWFGKWVLASPGAHRIHHSDHPDHFGKNLSATLPILDHLFGTWYAGSVPVTAVGVTEARYTPMTLPFDWLRDVLHVVAPAPIPETKKGPAGAPKDTGRASSPR